MHALGKNYRLCRQEIHSDKLNSFSKCYITVFVRRDEQNHHMLMILNENRITFLR